MKIIHPVWAVLAATLAGFGVTAAANPQFVTNTLPVGGGSGSSPTCVATVDIYGTGKPALVTANQSYGTLTLLTNNGFGGFSLGATLSVGDNPQFVTAADVNGDGRQDLICANGGPAYSYPGSLTVLTNNGHGGFGSNATYSVGSFAICVAVADVNGDGKPDLISANWNDSTLTVLTNNGTGGFAVSATPVVGLYNTPQFVAAGDVNGDGRPDLISANSGDGTLTILTNDGHGGFSQSAQLAVGRDAFSNPYCVAVTDVNGDGKLDLVSANEGENTLTVLTNTGGSNFTLQTNLPVGQLNYSAYYVLAADLNGDGRPDLISANNSDNTLTVYTNAGSRFGLNATLAVGNGPWSIAAGDLNGDGKTDLACANNSAGTVTVLLTLPDSPRLAIGQSPGANQIVVSWNSLFAGFSLTTNANVTGTNWHAAGYLITTVNGTNFSTTLAPGTGRLFFRLAYP